MKDNVVRRSLASAALASLALTGLAACGDSSSTADAPATTSTPTPSPTPTVSDTPSPTPTPTPTTASPDVTPTAPPVETGGTPISAEAFAGIFENALQKATTAKLTLDTTGSAALTGTGQIDFSKKPPEVAAKLDSASFGGTADVRLVAGQFYLQLPSLGGKFIRYDISDPTNPFGALIANSLDPSSLVKILRSGIRSASNLGTENLSGDQVDHYALTIDSKAILAQYPASIRDAAASQLPPTVNYDMYFDKSGLLRRTQSDLGKAGKTTQSYDDWGSKVDIEAPPAADVVAGPTS